MAIVTSTSRRKRMPTKKRKQQLRRSFYTALGDFIVHWARMECALDLLIIITSIERSPPQQLSHQLSNKLKYLRRMAREFPEISLAALDLLSTLDVIEDLSEWRHALIHGAALWQMEARNDLLVVLMRFLNPSKQIAPSVTVTTSEIERTARELDAISDRLFDMAEAVGRSDTPGPLSAADQQRYQGEINRRMQAGAADRAAELSRNKAMCNTPGLANGADAKADRCWPPGNGFQR